LAERTIIVRGSTPLPILEKKTSFTTKKTPDTKKKNPGTKKDPYELGKNLRQKDLYELWRTVSGARRLRG